MCLAARVERQRVAGAADPADLTARHADDQRVIDDVAGHTLASASTSDTALAAEVDGKPVCAVVPSDGEVSMKKLAGTFHGKSARMMKPADAERLTGYHVGGISPFGQKKTVPTAIEQAALRETTVFINGGQRGLQVELAPADACNALGAIAADLMA